MTSSYRILGVVLFCLICMACSSWAQTLNVDAASLMSRLDRIERRLQKLEAQGVSAGGSTAGASGDVELRMQDLERESSQNNGTVERLGNSVQQLAKKMDALSKDLDMRLQDLENKPAVAAPAAPAAESTVPDTTAPAGKTAAKTEAIPDNLSATDHYNKAYAYLTAADYANAQAWFVAFLKKYPKDKLADNAYYWLGEVYLVENNPTEAVKSFKGGLQNFPQGTKAPANLLKLGLALQQLKQLQFARAAWEKLQKDFPRSVEASKAKDYLLALPAAEKTAEKAEKKA